MHLEPVTIDDLSLYESMFCDEIYMKDLGGAQPRDKVPGILQQQVNCMESGKGWVYKVMVPSESEGIDVAVGTVCLWEGWWDKENCAISELGFGIVRSFQGRGYGSAALSMLMNMVASTQSSRWGDIHAFTSCENGSSNRVLEKSGFKLIGKENMVYDGRSFPGNHWVFSR